MAGLVVIPPWNGKDENGQAMPLPPLGKLYMVGLEDIPLEVVRDVDGKARGEQLYFAVYGADVSGAEVKIGSERLRRMVHPHWVWSRSGSWVNGLGAEDGDGEPGMTEIGGERSGETEQQRRQKLEHRISWGDESVPILWELRKKPKKVKKVRFQIREGSVN